MKKSVDTALARLSAGGNIPLSGGLKGIEKESLRAATNGDLAQTPHPKALGSPLTHAQITTDYSEALLELVTAPHAEPLSALGELDLIHRFVYHNIGEEILWNASMPCVVHGEKSIPIARYGQSNVAKMKEVYRIGLGHRYGRVMQAISGIHFNYSLPETIWPLWQAADGEKEQDPVAFRSEKYMGLVRNYLRVDWLILYLFGASPAVCKSFFKDLPDHSFEELDNATVFAPYGTSLRMSDIGYQNKAPFPISRRSIKAYADSLDKAIDTPYAPFEKIELLKNGAYQQLNQNMLQIANEYYSAIRPKQPTKKGERPTTALKTRGIQYVEVRSIDINPAESVGISPSRVRFLEALLITCALATSPDIDDKESDMIRHNQLQVARQGRKPGLMLHRPAGEIGLAAWARQILDAMYPICAILDENEPTRPYTVALDGERQKVNEPDFTPSARELAEMHFFDESYFQYAMRKSLTLQQYFLDRPLPAEIETQFKQKAADSLAKQAELEANETLSFDQYLEAYFKR